MEAATIINALLSFIIALIGWNLKGFREEWASFREKFDKDSATVQSSLSVLNTKVAVIEAVQNVREKERASVAGIRGAA